MRRRDPAAQSDPGGWARGTGPIFWSRAGGGEMLRIMLLSAILLGALIQQALPRQGPGQAASGLGASAAAATEFGRLIERLSEPGGYFDTDNLISNEASYLHVLGRLRKLQTSGGAYIGVGPDQNFSYMAQIRPRI